MKKLLLIILFLLIVWPMQAQAEETVPTTADVTLAWDAVEGAQWYVVRWSTENKRPYQMRKRANETQYEIPNLTIGTKYFFAVTAHAKKIIDGVEKTIDSPYSKILEYVVKGDNIIVKIKAPINIRIDQETSIIEIKSD